MAMVRPGGSKYHATKVIVDGITFDSKREAKRYQELKLMERAGAIKDLRRQVRYELLPAFDVQGKRYRPTTYVADFVYTEDGKEVTEDVKGMKTPVYLLKRKLFAYKYGVSIRET